MLKLFKVIAIIEGISCLGLFLFAMPMKYIWKDPSYIFNAGLIHGVLFCIYMFLAIMLKIEENWPLKKFGIISIASVIPFGTFYIEKKYL